MILNKQINKGWVISATVLATRKVRATSNLVAGLIASKRVSAANFHKLESLASLLNHYKLHPDDKNIWDNSYADEYGELIDIDTWETLT